MVSRINTHVPLLLAVVALLVMTLMGGCSGEGDQSAPETDQPVAAAVAEPEVDQSLPQVQRIDVAGLQRVIGAYKGDVVLVELWATWCPACIRAFPKVIQWHKDFSEEGLRIVGVSLDFPADHEKVVEFVAEEKPPFEIYHLEVQDFAAFVKAFAPEWAGTIPAVVLFGRDGKRRQVLQGADLSTRTEELVRQMLEETPG